MEEVEAMGIDDNGTPQDHTTPDSEENKSELLSLSSLLALDRVSLMFVQFNLQNQVSEISPTFGQNACCLPQMHAV